ALSQTEVCGTNQFQIVYRHDDRNPPVSGLVQDSGCQPAIDVMAVNDVRSKLIQEGRERLPHIVRIHQIQCGLESVRPACSQIVCYSWEKVFGACRLISLVPRRKRLHFMSGSFQGLLVVEKDALTSSAKIVVVIDDRDSHVCPLLHCRGTTASKSDNG